jgi:hypothetical protein
VSIVQQRIGPLSGEIELNVARRTPLRQQAAELGSSAGDRHAYRRGNTTGKHPGADGVIRHFLRLCRAAAEILFAREIESPMLTALTAQLALP